MEQIIEAEKLAKAHIENYPSKEGEVNDLLELMISEIENGSSPDGELHSFTQSLEELLD